METCEYCVLQNSTIDAFVNKSRYIPLMVLEDGLDLYFFLTDSCIRDLTVRSWCDVTECRS